MDWLKRMNKSLDYIEENLHTKMDIEDIARSAFSSKFHYQRLFHMLSGITLSEYIRNRKLTLAAQELTNKNCKVIDVAFKYGYESSESFSRAFNHLHGISPSKAKETGNTLIAQPKLVFQIYLEGEKQMNYRIEKKDSFKIIGVSKEFTTINNENFKKIPQFWSEVMENGQFEELMKESDGISYGVCKDYLPEDKKFTYVIGVNYTNQTNFDVIEIPACTWVIFDCTGPMPDSIQNMTKRIFHEWFPSTGYEHADAPEIEVYYPDDPNNDDIKAEIWIPIK